MSTEPQKIATMFAQSTHSYISSEFLRGRALEAMSLVGQVDESTLRREDTSGIEVLNFGTEDEPFYVNLIEHDLVAVRFTAMAVPHERGILDTP